MPLTSIVDKLNGIFEGTPCSSSKKTLRVNLKSYSGISFFINYEKSNYPSIYFFCKTTSWHFDGCRTDLHDVLSLFFAIFFKVTELSISFRVIHISNDFGVPDREIKSAYCKAEQIDSKLIGDPDSGNLDHHIENLIVNMFIFERFFWQWAGCPCEECQAESKFDEFFNFEANKLFKKNAILTLGSKEDEINSFSRKHPNWEYLRDFKKEMTVIYAPELVNFLKNFISLQKVKQRTIPSVNGNLYLLNDTKNYVNKSVLLILNKAIKSLENADMNDNLILAFENETIGIGNNYIVTKVTRSGFEQYKIEREKLRIRHSRESQYIFPVTTFIWSAKINADRFESMIKELLEKEKGILSVRKSGITNEGDNARDLIVRYSEEIPKEKSKTFSKLQTRQIKIVAQCKAYSKNVGKSMVRDIRDTIEFHKSQGYFLIVSSLITTSLVDHLEALQDQFEFIDWWTRDEIEERLKQNIEILSKYSDIVKAKN